MQHPWIRHEVREGVRAAVRAEMHRPAQPEVLQLIARLQERFGAHLVAALYYGSCRRQQRPEGVIDLHVLVDDLPAALGPVAGRLNRLLPPNVYYLETGDGAERIRCKYAVLSLDQFRRQCTRAAFHSYFWARYAQPLTVLGSNDPVVRATIEDGLVEAVATLASRALPRLPGVRDWRDFWIGALGLCYRAELRAEGGGRAETLVGLNESYYRATGEAMVADWQPPERPGWKARLDWWLRSMLGKPLSLLRLIKGLYTFDGGLDYIAWKLERHTGRPVTVPDKVRRRPLIHLWPLIWKLWREGMFR